ncbi:MAG TPA: addiction module protein [Firmicutes bacterium]|jgi:putative addiction module component (TIGR02574 family)|nr:addiction module protein [Bacillota bacterium]
MKKTQDLFNEALSLPLEIRAQLIDKLIRSIHPVQEEIDELWAIEAEKRIEEIQTDKIEKIAGDEVFKKILNR